MTKFATEPSLRPPCPAGDLCPAERFLVRSFRLMVFTENPAPGIARDFRRRLGEPAAHRSLGAFFSLVGLLSHNGRRRMRFRMPHCRSVSADERALVALLAAAQAAHREHVMARLDWLLPAGVQQLAYAYTVGLARAFDAAGLAFAAPVVGRPAAGAGHGPSSESAGSGAPAVL